MFNLISEVSDELVAELNETSHLVDSGLDLLHGGRPQVQQQPGLGVLSTLGHHHAEAEKGSKVSTIKNYSVEITEGMRCFRFNVL